MTEDQFEKLAQMIKGVHDEMSEGFDEMKESFDEMDGRLGKIETDTAYILAELRSIKHRLEDLEKKITSQGGYAKEIDYALSRIAVIEKHLGITPAAA